MTPAGASTVAPGAALTLNVTCTPTAAGNRTALMAVQDDATGESKVNLACTGTTP